MRLYVGNLPFSTGSDELREIFGQHGEVVAADVVIDRDTGRSRGFAFVEMKDSSGGNAAIEALNGFNMGGRPLKVNEAKPREERSGGGGFGGATAAKYIKRLNPKIQVTLVEPLQRYYTCPFTNLHFGGLRTFEQQGHNFNELRALGVQVIHALANDVDNKKKTVTLAGGRVLQYDKLVLSPGIDIRWGALKGYDQAAAQLAPHAWQAGPQTTLLKRQLDAMPDGGTFILVAPDNPFRCLPGPMNASPWSRIISRRKSRSRRSSCSTPRRISPSRASSSTAGRSSTAT